MFFVFALYSKMASGRSARLPPTPSHTSNIQHLIDASSGYTSDPNLQTATVDNTINGTNLVQAQVLDGISENERKYILNVLDRNNEVHERDAMRIM